MSKFDNFKEKFEKFKEIISELQSENLSESDTRSKLIDYVLKDLLGWEEQNIRREKYGDSGYLDYIVRLNSYQFVIEAKKIFTTLNLPTRGRRHKLRSIYAENKDIINQIRGYLLDNSLTHGVITNGQQFVIARFVNTDGKSWLENDALIFQSLEKLEGNLIEFYNLISIEAIEENGRITIHPVTEFSKCVIDGVPEKTQEVTRNEFSSKLLPIIDDIFTEIGNREDKDHNLKMLEECYVTTGDFYKYSEELNNLFKDLPPTFSEKISKARNTQHIASDIKSNLTSDAVPAPIVLIGGKGSGKTTFIKYFFKIILNEREKKEIPSVYLDFRNYTEQQIDDTNSIYQTILENLLLDHKHLKLSDKNILRKIFHIEIENKAGLWSGLKEDEIERKTVDYLERLTEDPQKYLAAISAYLIKFQRRRISLVFDNADQLENSSQKKIFLMSQSLRGTLKAMVFVSLREGYFYQWKDKPPFDAFHSTVYHISAPPYSYILAKRIRFAINEVKFEQVNSIIENKRIAFEDATLKDLFINLNTTLFSNTNPEIMKYLEQTSYPNIRKGLEEMNNFLVSGHTKIDSYITAQPTIPIWEFVKSIGLNNKRYYLKKFSTIYNVFYPNHHTADHFIKPMMLKYLYSTAVESGFKDKYKRIPEVIEAFINVSYSRDCIEAEMSDLLKNQMIVSNAYSSDIDMSDEIANIEEVRISNKGIYYISELISRFHYLDLVLQDTPIKDEQYYNKIIAVFPHADASGYRNLNKRLKSTELFVDYLVSEEQKIRSEFDIAEQDSVDYIASRIRERFLNDDKPRIVNVLRGRYSR